MSSIAILRSRRVARRKDCYVGSRVIADRMAIRTWRAVGCPAGVVVICCYYKSYSSSVVRDHFAVLPRTPHLHAAPLLPPFTRFCS